MSAILEAASQLFDRGSATTTAIAQRAGVSIGSLYEYFRDKESILQSLVDRHVREAEAELHAAIDGVELRAGSLAAAIRNLVATMVRLHGDRPTLQRRIVAVGMHSAVVQRRIAEAERTLTDRLAALVRAHPDTRVADPRLAARVVAVGTNALVHRHVEDDAGIDAQVLVDELTRLWTGYLAGAPAPETDDGIDARRRPRG